MKKSLTLVLVVLLTGQLVLPAGLVYAAISPQIADFLCQKGIAYYDIGKYPEALTEFKKALLANPESDVAREFIAMLEGPQAERQMRQAQALLAKKIASVNASLENIESPETASETVPAVPAFAIDELRNNVLKQKKENSQARPPAQKTVLGLPLVSQEPSAVKLAPEVTIDVAAKQEGKDYVDVSVYTGDHITMRGRNITRFLVTEPAFLKVTRLNENELLVEPQDAGATYLHIWDESGRNTFKYTIGPHRFVEELLQAAQEKWKEESRPESFKYTYSIESDSFMTGRGIGDLKRQTLNYGYTSALIGETPYGNFDSAVAGSRTTLGTYRVSNIRLGLTDGHYDQFKGFSIRGLDFSPAFSSFGFPTTDLRGVLLDSPMFNRTLSYTAFWGALPGGQFTQISQSSGLSPTEKAWLEGIGINYRAGTIANFKTFFAHSYGPDLTQPVLTNDVTGFGMDYHLGHFDIDSQMVYDFLKDISYTAMATMTLPKLRIGLSTTDNSKHFATVFGGNTASGSNSQTLSINYRPVQDITITNTISQTVDKVFGNPARPGRPNYNSATRVNWTLDPQTEVEVGYTLDDELGSVAPSFVESKEIVLRKQFFFFRKLSTFLSYQNSKSKNITSPAQDFNNNRIMTGISARLLYEIYAYYRREINLMMNKFTGETALPMAQEVGLNYNRRIFNTLFYTNLRVSYRTEENTESSLSFLSGENRLEGEGELTYRPTPDNETFIKARVTNVWAAKQGVAKHFDVDFNWGMRFLWDTGFRWDPVGGFCGYVYYDINGDGTRQPLEKGMAGAVIKVSDGKTVKTDANGFYKVTHVKGKEAVLTLDQSTIPRGYGPTTPASRDVDIVNAKVKKVDFGITTRSEISGLVFNDKNNNGIYEPGEESLNNVVLILDDKARVATNPLGEYMFRKLTPGEHTLKIDLKTLPVKFIPKVPVIKKVKVLEGTTFIYNIPLAETKKMVPATK